MYHSIYFCVDISIDSTDCITNIVSHIRSIVDDRCDVICILNECLAVVYPSLSLFAHHLVLLVFTGLLL
jgi:hypothetical protein